MAMRGLTVLSSWRLEDSSDGRGVDGGLVSDSRNASLRTDRCSAGRRGTETDTAIFLDITIVKNIKLCVMAQLTELYRPYQFQWNFFFNVYTYPIM